MIEFHKSKTAEKLSKQKSLKEYALTALKEIPLVVMSILIALQLDTWYEENKLQHEQQQILTDLLVELREDSLQLAEVLEFQNSKRENLDEVLQLIDGSAVREFNRVDSLYAAATTANPTFFPARGVYEAISS